VRIPELHTGGLGFEAAQVSPLEKESLWVEHNYGRWIADMDDTAGVSKINSLRNGFLLSEHIHSQFDRYLLSANPDVCFTLALGFFSFTC